MNYELHFEECWKQYNIVSMGFLQGLYKVNGALGKTIAKGMMDRGFSVLA
jgi:hypothetical protein